MPTECERSVISSATTKISDIKDNNSATNFNEDLQQTNTMMESGDMSTSQTSTTSNGSSSCNGGGRKASITSPDPTAYVAKARVTRPTPPPPPYNPMQFVQIKPCNLYQTAQEQLKKAEEVKKIKEIRKEEPEDWQNNLDNWKSSRRKRVEHIIDRVVEVKKLELEEHDRMRRKSKTFSEMIEERGERAGGRGLNKLVSLAVYAEDEANDLSDLGIGTSSASGKSSLSEDYDNNSVMSDNAAELDKAITNNTHHKPVTESTIREYISSPGYETSSSTAPTSSPDPCEYTYEGAIQDYKQRVSRAASGLTSVVLNKFTSQQQNSKESTPERTVKETSYPPRRGSKIEDRLVGFEVQSPSEECAEKNKVDVPKIDISKRKEIFESQQQQQQQTQTVEPKSQLVGNSNSSIVPRVTLRDRFKVQGTAETTLIEQPKKEPKRLSGDITSIKERLQSLEQQQNLVNGANGANKTTANKLVDIPVPPLKERLSSLQNAVTKEEVRKPPVVLIDARQLEIMKVEEEKAQQSLKGTKEQELNTTTTTAAPAKPTEITETQKEIKTSEAGEIDRDDSGIHTADDIELEERLQVDMMKKEQELKLNAAIEALAKEEKQLSEAANAVNQIEAEFEELSLSSVAMPSLATTSSPSESATPITNDHMEYSVSSTNPTTSSIYSNNIDNNNNNSNSENSDSIGNSNEVKGLEFKTASNLHRKPTNEMVHAKNLLKIFKETFQNDIELDEHEVNEESETKSIGSDKELTPQRKNIDLGLNIKTQAFENSNSNIKSPITNPISKDIEETSKGIGDQATPISPQSPKPTYIPRCMTPLVGKPPMSPQTVRSTKKFAVFSPPGSPSLARKADSQFSINGRVEIFNSKTMTSPPKATTPTMTTKKIQLPYINITATPKSLETNNIVLLQQDATTKQQTNTVIEPLSTTLAASNRQNQQQEEKQQHKKNEQMKSMPSQQMVNEPQIKLDEETYQHEHHQQFHQPNHNNESVKQQQQQSEVIVCAPPITIVNPDELPKPNTVKNLSSCFQKQDTTKTAYMGKQIVPKPLPRSRIPQATPPQSPLVPKRHICYSSTQSSSPSKSDKSNKLSSSASPLEEEKKLSIISSSSTSSTSTDSTVIDNSKKLSILSNVSSISGDVTATVVLTNAQVHRGEENDEEVVKNVGEIEPKTDKTLDKETTQSLVEGMIQADTKTRALTPMENPITSSITKNIDTPKSVASSPLFSLQSTNIDMSVKTPTSPIYSPKSELFKTTTPLVVSTLYDKYQPTLESHSNQGISKNSEKSEPIETFPTIIVPAELPPLLDCSPNESTLYKLAASAPHSPTSPSSNSEKNLTIDSDICNSLLASLASAPDVLQMQRQHTVEEDLCQKVDKETLPFHQGSTGFKDVSQSDIKHCEGLTPSSTTKLHISAQKQKTVEEELCQKLDINNLPDDKRQPVTGYKSVSPTEIRKCDFFGLVGSAKPNSKPNLRPNSPIAQARAAHSKALIETCEKIIAEERLASSQLKSSLPSSSVDAPIIQKKSKIPKPITSCCKATESLNEADLRDRNQELSSLTTPKDDKNGVIARMHVVETQIKVTTTTPPPSPKAIAKPQSSPQPVKKTKNIFDFLKKNFGVGGSHSHKDEHEDHSEPLNSEEAVLAGESNKILVLTEKELEDLEKVKFDEIHTFDNSKFYLPSSDVVVDDENTVTPPPLPKTPAPVNIEITRKIITDEILENDKTEKDLTQEIDDLLDDELNMLNHEIEELEKAGKKQ